MPQPEALLRALAARGAASPAALEWHPTIVSTNDRARELARAAAPEWTVVLADEQTAGRGRAGRSWASPPGGVYLSVLLRPRFAALSLVPLAAGLAVADAAQAHGAPAELKWPNDVLVGGRKLAGILADAASSPAGVEWVVLGIGVNVAGARLPQELVERSALLSEWDPTSTVPEVAAALLAALRVWYDALAASPASVLAAWRQRAVGWWGENVEVRTGNETFSGRLLDVDEEGALLVKTANGTRRVLSGELLRLRRGQTGG